MSASIRREDEDALRDITCSDHRLAYVIRNRLTKKFLKNSLNLNQHSHIAWKIAFVRIALVESGSVFATANDSRNDLIT
jgi:hypothetical protein